MKKITLICLISIFLSINSYAADGKKCSELDGFKRLGKNSIEYLKCLKETKLNLNTDSKLTDIVTGKKKLKMPNPLNGIKKLGQAIKPDPL